MGTDVRPEISKASEYYLSKHRYYELKHFCLQYKEWRNLRDDIGMPVSKTGGKAAPKGMYGDKTCSVAFERLLYRARIDLIERAAEAADPVLAPYILEAVTEGLSYPQLKARLDVPCGKDMWYDRYRRFFSILDVLKTRSERKAI